MTLPPIAAWLGDTPMKAILCRRYGSPDSLCLEDVPPPPAPGDGEVMVRIHATSINAGDWHLMRGSPPPVRLMFGMRRPKHPVLGSDFAGRVTAVGAGVSRFRVGDGVMGELSGHGFGAFAEYVRVPESALAAKPDALSDEEAAALPMAAVTALQGLRDHGGIESGQRVLIHGASGGVGTYAVQLAKAHGAEVTGVCRTEKAERVRALGVDHVIDHTREEVTQSGARYDLILDTAARHSVFRLRHLLTPGGRYVLVGGPFGRLLGAMVFGSLISRTGGRKLGAMLAQPRLGDVETVRDLAVSGAIRPAIDRVFTLGEVPEAMAYLESGKAFGKLTVRVGRD